jgi:hypothetical protein
MNSRRCLPTPRKKSSRTRHRGQWNGPETPEKGGKRRGWSTTRVRGIGAAACPSGTKPCGGLVGPGAEFGPSYYSVLLLHPASISVCSTLNLSYLSMRVERTPIQRKLHIRVMVWLRPQRLQFHRWVKSVLHRCVSETTVSQSRIVHSVDHELTRV